MQPMDTSTLSAHKAKAGFSLIEVTMAIGIVAFAFMSVLGLIPVGLNVFEEAIHTSLEAQIAQRVIDEAQQTDFNALVNDALASGSSSSVRFFDGQSNEIKNPK